MARSTGSGDEALRVLLVEDNAGDARLVREALASGRGSGFLVQGASSLSEALERLAVEPFDVVLLDLGLPDSQGLATFAQMRDRSRAVPIVVLSGLDDEQTAIDAVRLGAQDYLVKGKYDGGLLERAIRYAVERQRLLDQLVRALGYAKSVLEEPIESDEESGEREADLLAVCAWCKRVRDVEGQWQTIEEYLTENILTPPTQGMCPRCAQNLPPVSGRGVVR